jgi:hypothetical protein
MYENDYGKFVNKFRYIKPINVQTISSLKKLFSIKSLHFFSRNNFRTFIKKSKKCFLNLAWTKI